MVDVSEDPAPTGPADRPEGGSPPPAGGALDTAKGRKGLFAFLLFAVAAVLLSRFTPLGEWLTMEKVRRTAEGLGVWGPLVIAAVGIFSPLLFLPRWPVAFVSGLLYGIFWGTALATTASTLGAWLHFLQARTLLSGYSAALLRRSGFAGKRSLPGRSSRSSSSCALSRCRTSSPRTCLPGLCA